MPWLCNLPQPDILSAVVHKPTRHTLSAPEYWQRLRPKLNGFGISRVADITGLDRIGLPVVQAIRPNARSNAVTQGKAQSLEAAAVGAVLECLEMAAGERLDRLPCVQASEPDVWTKFAPGLPSNTTWPTPATDYISCWNITSDCPAALPRDLISTDFSVDAPACAAPILRHSIGLGAGTTLAAALLHGLLECIEADARLRQEAGGISTRLALDEADPAYGDMLGQLIASGLRVAVYALPCKAGISATKVSLMEAPGALSLPLPAVGYAARPTQSAAIAAALSEAIQARLAVISGAREDITQRFYSHGISAEALEAEWERHGQSGAIPSQPDTSPPPSLPQIAAAVGPVYARPLHWDPQLPLAILRVVAPDLVADPLRLAQI